MGTFSREELEAAFEHYCAVNDAAFEKGDWSGFAGKFTRDALYVEHAYGRFEGREAIRDWIVKVMAPLPMMDFPMDWHLVDAERGWVVFQCQNRLPHPTDPDGDAFQFPSWTLLHYAGDNLWSYEEDMYNPAEAATVVKAWLDAGGTFAGPEQVPMEHGGNVDLA
jgi:hypothetical protein